MGAILPRDTHFYVEGSAKVHHSVRVSKAPDAQLMESDDVGRMFESISDMDCREATVIRMRFGLDSYDAMTLREVGENLGLTRERVRQIENLALKHLRRSLESGGPAGK